VALGHTDTDAIVYAMRGRSPIDQPVSMPRHRHPTPPRNTGCAAFPDTARSIGACAVWRHQVAVQGEGNMNRSEIVSHIAAETSASRASAERMVATVFSTIADALGRDEPVIIAGFGKFDVRSRAARQGRNPQTGEPVAIPASKVPSFKAAKALRDAVNG